VRGASDSQLERRFGSRAVQRILFEGMARAYTPEAAAGFQGRIVYELERDGATDRWTIEVRDGRAKALPGADGGRPELLLRLPVVDFARIAAGEEAPLIPFLEGRATMKGNFEVAARLSEMFGGPSPY
jgi:putative sterol carrier protein